MTNSEAVAATIDALRAEGKLGEADEAFVALALGLAAAVDADPENAALWREYRAALATLTTVGTGAGDDDTQSFLVAVSSAVRHSAIAGEGELRAGGGGGRRAARPAPDAVATTGGRRRPRAAGGRTPSVP